MARNPNAIPGAQRGDAQAVPIPGFMQRAAAGLRLAVTGRIDPNAGWFGPGEPRMPVAPPDVAGRQFDFPTGWNTRQNPRTDEEGTSFAELRALADNYDLLRLVLETRKDQMCSLAWRIAPKAKDAKPDARSDELTAFFMSPDKQNSWATWLRMLLEDLFVLDAPTLYPRATRGGGLYSLEPVDGATVKRLLDASGRSPMPPDVAYQQVLKGLPAVDYTRDELIYAPRNPRTFKVYGYSPVEQIIITVNIALRRQASMLEYYQSGSVPDAIASVPKEWTPSQIRDFQEFWDLLLTGDLAARRRLRFIPDGVRYQQTKEPVLKDQFDEWLARVVCFAFSVEPTPFVAQVNRAVAETSRQQSLAEGIGPTKKWLKDLIDGIIATRFGAPDLAFEWVDEDAIGPRDKAEIDRIYVDAKVLHPDEVRADLGRDPLTPEQKADLAPPPHLSGPPADGAGAPPDDDGTNAAGGSATKLGKSVKAGISRERPAVTQAAHALERVLSTFFERQASVVAERLSGDLALDAAEKAEGGPVAALSAAQRRRLRDALRDVDLDDWSEVVPEAERWMTLVGKDGVREGLVQLGIDTTAAALEQPHVRAVAWAKQRAAELVGMKWVDGDLVPNPRAEWAITDSTREFLRADVEQALADGWSSQHLAKQIAESYAFSTARARMVARTEMARADVQGSLIGYAAGGATGKRWLIGSETQCDVCEANAAVGVIDLDESFPDGTDGPPGHPNCVCDVIPVLPEDDAQQEPEQ